MTSQTVGEVASALVGLFLVMGLTVGLVVELGGVRRVAPRWRRFIGMAESESGPAHPRLWAVAIGLILLLVIEATLLARLAGAIHRSDLLGAIALSLHFMGLLVWLMYLLVPFVRRSS